MTICSTVEAGPQLQGFSHELHFASLHNPGRGLVVPCDAQGHVDLDTLSERLRTAYVGARALRRLGHANAWSLDGGLALWSEAVSA